MMHAAAIKIELAIAALYLLLRKSSRANVSFSILSGSGPRLKLHDASIALQAFATVRTRLLLSQKPFFFKASSCAYTKLLAAAAAAAAPPIIGKFLH